MNEILNTGDSVFTEFTFNNTVVGERKSSSLDFTTSSFVDKLGDSLSGWITVGNEWLDHLDHVPCGFVKLDENAIVQLSQSEELKDFLWLWCKLSDTMGIKKVRKTRQKIILLILNDSRHSNNY
tara:strand:- start:36 stop:407 length:372 start_codon:yes stop_codon:yes gene_type:complete